MKKPPFYRFEYFGGFRVHDAAGNVVTRFRSRQAGALLAYLAYHSDRSHSRELLCTLIWPDAFLEAARPRLSIALSSLRAQLEQIGSAGALITASKEEVGINAVNISRDTDEFRHMLRPDAPEAEKRAALALWRPTIAEGYYEDWITPEQERLNELWLFASLDLAMAAVAQNDMSAASDLLNVILLHFPENEAALALMARAGIELKPAAQPDQEPKLEEAPRRRGRPRKEQTLEQPEESSPATTPALGVQETTYFIRSAEEEMLTDAIWNPATSITTLQGSGGVGKTRLAREVLRRLASDPSQPQQFNVRSIDLSGVNDPDRLPGLIAEAFGVRPDDVHGTTPAAFRSAIQDAYRAQRASDPVRINVLFLDNFEYFVESYASWLQDLALGAQGLRVIVTSRLRLLVAEETTITIGALPLPPPGKVLRGKGKPSNEATALIALLEFPSVALFVDRGRRSLPYFRLTLANADAVIELVHHLEGIPLAIELAAARIVQFRPEEILSRIRDSGRYGFLRRGWHADTDRASSLWATLNWSMTLLTDELKTFLGRLSVFRGGWTLPAAEAVTHSDFALDDLAQLADASLVGSIMVSQDAGQDAGTEARFFMLETVREYLTAELLDQDDRDQAEAAHGEYFSKWISDAGAALQGPDQLKWMERIQTESANIHAAIDCALQRQTGEAARRALRLTSGMHRFWLIVGASIEGRKLLSRALAMRRLVDPPDPILVSGAVSARGILAMRQGDLDEARVAFRQALWLTRRYDPKNLRRVASLWVNMGIVASEAGLLSEARRWFEASLAVWREIGDTRFEGVALANYAIVLAKLGNLEQAEANMRVSIDIAREVRDTRGEAMRLLGAAQYIYLRGELREAETFFRACLPLFRALSDVAQCAYGILGISIVAQASGFPDLALSMRTMGESALQALQLPLNEFHILVYPLLGLTPLGSKDFDLSEPADVFQTVDRIIADPPFTS